MYNPFKAIYIILGFISLGLGFAGSFLPVLPTTPFLLLTSFCFAKSSESFHNWFSGTKLYKKYLEDFIKTKSMTLKSKIYILCLSTVMMLISCVISENLIVWIIISIVIVIEYLYFIFGIKTKSREDENSVNK